MQVLRQSEVFCKHLSHLEGVVGEAGEVEILDVLDRSTATVKETMKSKRVTHSLGVYRGTCIPQASGKWAGH